MLGMISYRFALREGTVDWFLKMPELSGILQSSAQLDLPAKLLPREAVANHRERELKML